MSRKVELLAPAGDLEKLKIDVLYGADAVYIGGKAFSLRSASNNFTEEELKKILGKKPVLGLGLGHQLVALALGAKTVKHKYGHRGGNQPVKCLESGKVYISTQNHGYDVLSDSVSQGQINFVNVNDNSCEGILYESLKALTVQFVPEACNIGNTVNPIYSKFAAFMAEEKTNA